MMAYKEEHLLCPKTTQVQKHLFVGWIISILKRVEPIQTKGLKVIDGNGMRTKRSELIKKMTIFLTNTMIQKITVHLSPLHSVLLLHIWYRIEKKKSHQKQMFLQKRKQKKKWNLTGKYHFLKYI